MNPERNVELEVIRREGVSACCLRREGVSTVEGGGALEGFRGEGFFVASGRRGRLLPRLPRARVGIHRALVPVRAPQ